MVDPSNEEEQNKTGRYTKARILGFVDNFVESVYAKLGHETLTKE